MEQSCTSSHALAAAVQYNNVKLFYVTHIGVHLFVQLWLHVESCSVLP